MTEATQDNKPDILVPLISGVLGLVLLVVGLQQSLVAVSELIEVAETEAPPIVTIDEPAAPAPKAMYQVGFENANRQWLMSPVGGGPAMLLPEFLPGPEQVSPPSRPMAAHEVGAFFTGFMTEKAMPLSSEAVAELVNLRVADQPIFTDSSALSTLSTGKTDDTAAESGPAPPPDTVKATVTPAATVDVIPAAINPTSDLFQRDMASWKRELGPTLRKIRLKKCDDLTWQGLTFTICPTARREILSRSWGKKKKHKVIYLQYLANKNGSPTTVDGGWGTNTRTALERMLADRFQQPDAVASYRQLLARVQP